MRFLLLLLPLLLLSCFTTDIVYGNKETGMIVDSLTSYSGAIHADIACSVFVDTGAPSVSLSTDENLLRYYEIDTSDGVIAIRKTGPYKLINSELVVHITVPHLSKVTALKGTLISEIPLTDEVILETSGESHYEGTIDTRSADISVLDSSSVSLSGPISVSNIEITSSESQDIGNLELWRTDIRFASEKTISLTCFERISGLHDGPGDIQLLTIPQFIYIKETGTGTILFPVEEDISSEH